MAKAEAQAMTWDHKGTAITLGTHGDFTATDANGKFVRAGSLDGVKKKLDAARESKFQPFKALQLSFYVDGYDQDPNAGVTEVNVTGLEKGSRRGSLNFVGDAPRADRWNRHVREAQLSPDTPECREAYHAYMKLRSKNDKLRDEMEKAEDALRDAIPVIKAESYQP